MLKKLIVILSTLTLAISLSACHRDHDKNTIRVGTIAGPETQLMEIAKKVALKTYGLHVHIIRFSDYNLPNAALNDGSLDANMFQHIPYLKAQIKARNYQLTAIGKTFVYPMAIYSKTLKQLKNIPDNAKVAIPDDPSNEARALLLLQKAQLIRLKPGVTINATPIDIASNPHHLKLVQLDAAQLPRALNDVTLAVINTNYAIPAGLSPRKDALFSEGPHSPYANVVVVRSADRNKPQLKNLVKALHSHAVLAAAQRIFGDGAIPAWPVKRQWQHHIKP